MAEGKKASSLVLYLATEVTADVVCSQDGRIGNNLGSREGD